MHLYWKYWQLLWWFLTLSLCLSHVITYTHTYSLSLSRSLFSTSNCRNSLLEIQFVPICFCSWLCLFSCSGQVLINLLQFYFSIFALVRFLFLSLPSHIYIHKLNLMTLQFLLHDLAIILLAFIVFISNGSLYR